MKGLQVVLVGLQVLCLLLGRRLPGKREERKKKKGKKEKSLITASEHLPENLLPSGNGLEGIMWR